MSKVRVLIDMFLVHPTLMIWVSTTSTSIVDLNLKLPSWLGWMKLFDVVLNWSLSLITFSMSLPTVLKRTIGLNDLGESYNFLFSLEMTIIVDLLKCEGQYPNSIQALVMWMIILRHSSSLRIILRWLHINLSGSGTEELLQLDKASLNSSFEKEDQGEVGLLVISLRMSISTWW